MRSFNTAIMAPTPGKASRRRGPKPQRPRCRARDSDEHRVRPSVRAPYPPTGPNNDLAGSIVPTAVTESKAVTESVETLSLLVNFSPAATTVEPDHPMLDYVSISCGN